MIKKILSILILFIFSAEIVFATTLTTNLTAYWKLDESSGTAADATGNGWTLTNNNTTPYGTGKINNGVQPATTGSKYLSRTDTMGLTPNANISVNAWINITSFASEAVPRVISISPSTSPYINWQMILSSTVWYIDRAKECVANEYVQNTFTMSTGTWYMFTFTWDGTTVTMYRNGTSVQTGTPSGNGVACGSNATYLGSADGASQFFNGTIDEVGVWSKVLTASEVSELYASGAGNQHPFGSASTPIPPDDGLILFE